MAQWSSIDHLPKIRIRAVRLSIAAVAQVLKTPKMGIRSAPAEIAPKQDPTRSEPYIVPAVCPTNSGSLRYILFAKGNSDPLRNPMMIVIRGKPNSIARKRNTSAVI